MYSLYSRIEVVTCGHIMLHIKHMDHMVTMLHDVTLSYMMLHAVRRKSWDPLGSELPTAPFCAPNLSGQGILLPRLECPFPQQSRHFT